MRGVEWSVAQRQFSIQHLRICDDILARPPLRHTHHSLELQRLHQHRCRGAQRRGRYVLRERRAERVAVPTSLDCRCGHGRIQEQSWRSGANQLGLTPVAADRVRTGSVSSQMSRKMEWLTDMMFSGALGFVAINNADSAWSTTFSTSLPDGSYCDVVDGAASGGNCTGGS